MPLYECEKKKMFRKRSLKGLQKLHLKNLLKDVSLEKC